MKTVLTIAGSDCSGGAGVQADIKTITVHGLYAMSVITALTAQNTTGVYGIQAVSPEWIARQIDCVFEDIRPDAVKLGMLPNAAAAEAAAERLACHQAKNIVIDPVMVSTSGSTLMDKEAREILLTRLAPMARILTPNLPEAQTLCGFGIQNHGDMQRAAEAIAKTTRTAVLIKGGHLSGGADDVLFYRENPHWFYSERIDTPNTHGTGCTLSSAIACSLATGFTLEQSVQKAKDYLTGALKAGLDLGKGSGPLWHAYEYFGR